MNLQCRLTLISTEQTRSASGAFLYNHRRSDGPLRGKLAHLNQQPSTGTRIKAGVLTRSISMYTFSCCERPGTCRGSSIDMEKRRKCSFAFLVWCTAVGFFFFLCNTPPEACWHKHTNTKPSPVCSRGRLAHPLRDKMACFAVRTVAIFKHGQTDTHLSLSLCPFHERSRDTFSVCLHFLIIFQKDVNHNVV